MKLGRYKHYKGEFYYDVFGFGHHVETQEKTVLYRPLYDIPELKAEYGDDIIFVRDMKIFTETVMIDGVETPRFEYVGE